MLTRCKFELVCALLICLLLPMLARADKLHLTDGTTIEADEVWDDPQGVWYRRGGVTYLVERAHVSKIEHEQHTPASDAPKHTQTSRVLDASAVANQTTQAPQPGARATDIAAVTSTDAPHQPVISSFAALLRRLLVPEVVRFIDHDEVVVAEVYVREINVA